MYHLELHKFPNKMARFNLSQREMLAIVMPWAQGEWVEFGERKWNTHEARLTVLEGPEIPVERLRVGHGWRLAQRQSEDITERLLEYARTATSAAPEVAGAEEPAGPPQAAPSADSLALQVLALLDRGPAGLDAVWELAASRLPGRPPAESLALAEGAVRSLLASRLIHLVRPSGEAGGEQSVGEGEIDELLASPASWVDGGDHGRVAIARSP